MSLLLAPEQWVRRAADLTGPLGELADGMARDLEQVLSRPLYISPDKALLSREGGRCARDGSLLEFDPFDEAHHRCGTCGAVYEGEYHRGFWRYWYHLWLAERAVHAAVLFRLRGDERHAEFAQSVLDGYADRYAGYPNQDNVLGPSRLFFSTYLESIWLLQLCIALDTLESAAPQRFAGTGRRTRELLIAPSAALIATYHEGMSNRQVWNVAAGIAAARVLGSDDAVAEMVHGPHGLAFLLATGLLADGTWYEGENYHLFAHRGLWYGVTMAERAGVPLDPALTARFDTGFIAPFLTALPDMTLPSRRDSQYAISLRQPRFAEPCELGLARRDDPALAGVLAALYDAPVDVPARSNGRWSTSADVERNLAAMRLTRADLGWRALLFARPALPAVEPRLPGSVLLEGQGIAVFRREGGRVYTALDYGHSGGGHGHPDRLNLLLVDGDTRWLDDMGTGSYVERTLHWYRSTLAHNAPLIDGHSQRRVDGALLAFEERGGAGWVQAELTGLAPGVRVVRTVVAMPDYLLDELQWEAGRDVTLDLPIHAPIDLSDAHPFHDAPLSGGGGLEDGFEFITQSSWRPLPAGEQLHLASPATAAATRQAAVRACIASDTDAEWWRLVAPGAPGRGDQPFHLARVGGRAGRIRTVWAWSADAAHEVILTPDSVRVAHAGGLADVHSRTATGWHVELEAGTARSSIDLAGLRAPAPEAREQPHPPSGEPVVQVQVATIAPARPLQFALGREDYRRSEQSWEEAGRPRASGMIVVREARLEIVVRLEKPGELVFAEEGVGNPFDNEPPEINADGMQLYVHAAGRAGAWTIVPVPGSSAARGVPVAGWAGLALADARWSRTAEGYELTAAVSIAEAWASGTVLHVGVIVNETIPERTRRRGQLVLGGAEGEWIYLRGDRHDPARLLPIQLDLSELS